MQVTETLNEGLKRAYTLTIAAADIDRKVDAAIAEVAPKVRMPGFRPGKVPGNLIRRMHGPALRQEAIQEAVSEGVQQLLSENSLRPATQPSVDLDSAPEDGTDLTVSVAMEVLPEVPEAEIEGIPLEKLVVEPDEAALDDALRRLADQQKSFTDAPARHKAKVGDVVVMDFAGSVDGVAFEGGTGTGMEIELGSGRLIPGFEDQLVGAKAGEAREVTLTIPADYPNAGIAGRDAVFAVTVVSVKTAATPVIDDSLATNLGLESLDQLKDVLKDQLGSELEGLTRTHMKRKLLDHLAATHHFDVPPSMVDAEFEQIWRQVTEGASDEDLAAAETDREDYARIAERRVRLGLLLSDIGTRNGVTVSQAEMNRLVAQEVARYPGQEAEVRRYFGENAMAAAQLRAPLFEEKVVDFILGKAVVTERTVTRAELEAAIESEDESPTTGGTAAPAKTRAAKKTAPADTAEETDVEAQAAPKRKAAPKAAKAKAPQKAAAPDSADTPPAAEKKPRAKKTPVKG
ncbi:MAG: trigger factor [Thermaurantiacus sp.]